MDLRTWLAQNQISVADFCTRIGAPHPQAVYRYLNGERIPRPEIMQRITAATNGAVTANDFYAQDTAA